MGMHELVTCRWERSVEDAVAAAKSQVRHVAAILDLLFNYSRAESWVIHKSVSLIHEPSSESPDISAM